MRRVLLFTAAVLAVIIIYCYASWAGETKLTPIPPACPTCCEVTKPYTGISADDLMRLHYYVKYTKFAEDYSAVGHFKLIDKKGYTRARIWKRYRIILGKDSKVLDYKDLVVMAAPENIKGLSVLSWTYQDPQRDQEVWLWLPSLRKIRRVSQSESDDSAFGSDYTTEEMSTRKWADETYQMVGEKTFPGFYSKYNGKTYYKGQDCYVVEARPKRKDWYYSKRISWLHKDFAGLIHDEVYDPEGRKFKVFLKWYETGNDKCIPQQYLLVENTKTSHSTTIDMVETHFNTGLKERFFTERTLMRSKW